MEIDFCSYASKAQHVPKDLYCTQGFHVADFQLSGLYSRTNIELLMLVLLWPRSVLTVPILLLLLLANNFSQSFPMWLALSKLTTSAKITSFYFKPQFIFWWTSKYFGTVFSSKNNWNIHTMSLYVTLKNGHEYRSQQPQGTSNTDSLCLLHWLLFVLPNLKKKLIQITVPNL